MRSLRLTSVKSTGDETSDFFREAEAFCEDVASSSLLVATPSKVYVLDAHYEIQGMVEWSKERSAEARLVDWSIHGGDIDKAVAVFDDGSTLIVNFVDFTVEAVGNLGPTTAVAWSPDGSRLAVASPEGDLTLVETTTFDLIAVADLKTEEVGSDALIDVGWGSTLTQFQGSAGRAKFKEPKVINRGAYTTDTHGFRLEWRADARLLCASGWMPTENYEQGERRVTVWSPDGVLISRLKNNFGLEEVLAVKPSGNLILTTRVDEIGRYGVLYERNGEPRREWPLDRAKKEESKSRLRVLKAASWDQSAVILALHYVDDDAETIELWTENNYQWERRLVVPFVGRRVKNWSWDTEKPRRLRVLTSDGRFSVLQFVDEENARGRGRAVVACTTNFQVSEFWKGVIPPPMCHYKLLNVDGDDFKSVVDWIFDGFRLAVIYANGELLTVTEDDFGQLSVIRQFKYSEELRSGFLWSLRWKDSETLTVVTGIKKQSVVELRLKETSSVISKELFTIDGLDGNGIIWQGYVGSRLIVALDDGEFRDVDSEQVLFRLQPSSSFRVKIYNDSRIIVLSSGHVLTIDGVVVSSAASSFLVVNGLLLFISLNNRLHFVDIETLKNVTEDRSVEQGARLVAAWSTNESKAATSLCMQMPRGNLETIHPRPFVRSQIREATEAADYVQVLAMMKKHRIDVNEFAFSHAVPKLLATVSDPDLPCLLIAGLSDEPLAQGRPLPVVLPGGKVERMCETIIAEFERLEQHRQKLLLPVLLSALVKFQRPRTQDALKAIKRTMDQEANPSKKEKLVSSWLRHLTNLVRDEEALHLAALATYDLRLCVTVAEHSQKDPREYLAILNRLRVVQPEPYRRYAIDVERKDFRSALGNLAELPEKLEEAKELITKKELYAHALLVYNGKSQFEEIARFVATWLESRASFAEAALLYASIKDIEAHIRCLEKARDWRGVLRATTETTSSKAEPTPKSLRTIADSLANAGKWTEAVEVMERIHPAPAKEELVAFYAKAYLWSRAVECDEDSKSVSRELVKDRATSILDEITVKELELRRHLKRLTVVRETKAKQLQSLVDGETTWRDFEGADAFSEMSSVSRSSRMTSASTRRRKRVEKKKTSLREGGEYEDAALLNALKTIVTHVNTLIGEACELLAALVRLNEFELGQRLQTKLEEYTTAAQRALTTGWPARIKPEFLVGLLHDVYASEDGTVTLPEGGGMPPTIVLDHELIAPTVNVDASWKLKILLA